MFLRSDAQMQKLLLPSAQNKLLFHNDEMGTRKQFGQFRQRASIFLTGLAGSNLWEETLCDLLVETCLDAFHDVPTKIYMWKVFKREPEPEDSAKVMEEVKQRITKGLGYIQSVAEKKGKKFLVCDTVS